VDVQWGRCRRILQHQELFFPNRQKVRYCLLIIMIVLRIQRRISSFHACPHHTPSLDPTCPISPISSYPHPILILSSPYSIPSYPIQSYSHSTLVSSYPHPIITLIHPDHSSSQDTCCPWTCPNRHWRCSTDSSQGRHSTMSSFPQTVRYTPLLPSPSPFPPSFFSYLTLPSLLF
jgi:hypothetical protein